MESRGFKLDEEKRAIIRTILTGAFKSGENLKKAGIRTSDICPHCKAGEAETAEHIWWKCKAWECKRRQWMDEYDHRQIEGLPTCTKKCAILTRRSERGEALKDLRAEEWPEQRPPMREEGKTWDEAFSEDGKLIAASDGACPNQQGDNRARRSGQGLFHREGHACNSSWPTDTYSQRAPRAEVRAAARWVAWAWGPTELWTDSALVVRGMRNILSGFTHGMKGHKDLWRRIELGINAKGKENFAVKKVKGHLKEI